MMTDGLRVIYEDSDILVCHKSAGLATEGAGVGRLDLISAARNYISRSQRKNGTGRQRNLPPYVATVNRLDQPVEGVLVLAKNKKTASDLSAQIRKKRAGKYYYALCCGLIPEDKGHLVDNLIRREDNHLAQAISDEEKDTLRDGAVTLNGGDKVRLIGGEIKRAELEYEVVTRTKDTTLIRVHLLTGRFHQIRVQLSTLGFPILGDDKYGNSVSKEISEKEGITNVCLAAYRMEIVHPGTKKKMVFEVVPDNEAINRLLK